MITAPTPPVIPGGTTITLTLPRLRRAVGPAAEDIFGDAMLITFERWDEVASMAAPLAWTWTVAKRLAWRRSAREARRPQLEALMHRPDGDERTMDADLFLALACLRPEHAAAFRLTQMEDHDLASAAEQVFSPQAIERCMVERGHGAHVDAAMECLVDRPVRWELHIDRGRYWCGTDDGERVDFGQAALGVNQLHLQSIATIDYVDGVKTPIPLGSIMGWSRHRLDLDGDRLRMALVSTEIAPLNGVPDEVFQHTIYDGITFQWQGRSAAA